jgi:hypothetical protein
MQINDHEKLGCNALMHKTEYFHLGMVLTHCSRKHSRRRYHKVLGQQEFHMTWTVSTYYQPIWLPITTQLMTCIPHTREEVSFCIPACFCSAFCLRLPLNFSPQLFFGLYLLHQKIDKTTTDDNYTKRKERKGDPCDPCMVVHGAPETMPRNDDYYCEPHTPECIWPTVNWVPLVVQIYISDVYFPAD